MWRRVGWRRAIAGMLLQVSSAGWQHEETSCLFLLIATSVMQQATRCSGAPPFFTAQERCDLRVVCGRSTSHNLPLAAVQGVRRTRRLRLAARKLRCLVAMSAGQAMQLPPWRSGGARGNPLIVAAVNATTAVHCCKECQSSGHAHCLRAACHQHTCLQRAARGRPGQQL